jgi:hypothetical protein
LQRSPDWRNDRISIAIILPLVRLLFYPLHVLVRQAEMVADLVDQDMADDVFQIFAGLAPVVQDRPAVERACPGPGGSQLQI